MPLPISPAARHELKRIIICISLGNLCFLRRWYDIEHLQARAVDYFRSGPADHTLLSATLIAAKILAAAFWLAWWLVRRSGSPRLRVWAHAGFLLVLMFPIESIRRYWNIQVHHFDYGASISLFVVEALLAWGIVMRFRGNPRVVLTARRVVLMLIFFGPSLLFDLSWAAAAREPVSAFQPRPSLPMLPARTRPRSRVVWLLFDEFDQRLAFDERPSSVALPELDRLRSESVVANHATQTAPWTILALPSLLSSRLFVRADLADASTLLLFTPDSHLGVNWRDEPNVFQRARKIGANAAVVGWHHPYCRVLGDSLVRCFEEVNGHPTDAALHELAATNDGLLKTVLYLFHLQWENFRDMFRPDDQAVSQQLKAAFEQRRQLGQYFAIRDRVSQDSVDPQIDFLFVHMPTPHLFAIYDRRRGDFTLSSRTSYLDNLALVDRTIGELRCKLEQAGLWDSTTVLITGDHGLRPALWRGGYNWTPEIAQLTAREPSETVPFIVKLAGRREGVVYRKTFSNIVSADLTLAVLRGEISRADQLTSWLDRRSSKEGPGVKNPSGVPDSYE